MTMAASLSPDGTRLAVLTDTGGGALLDAAALERVADLPGGWACAWTPAGRLLVGEGATIHEFDRNGVELATLTPLQRAGNVSALVFAGRIIAGYEEGTVWIGPPRE